MHTGSQSFRNGGETAKRMAEAAALWLAALSPNQRDKAVFPIESGERKNWHYIPRPRKGLPIKEMDDLQRRLAWILISEGLSREGFRKTVQIMGLEKILGEIEGRGGRHVRDPELFYLSIFGEPGTSAWGWRVEGHHVSLNYLAAGEGRDEIAWAPNFLGANPARVPEGYSLEGLRILEGEEEKARDLLRALASKQRRKAMYSAEAPPDILTAADEKASVDAPLGLAASEMAGEQTHLLSKLIGEYVHRMPEEIADRRMNEISKEGEKHIHFAWAGGTEVGQPHYYRVHGPSFLIEYDNTQNGANHIHSVWRDLRNDWGEDLLRAHRKESHKN
ncbi:MAG TPA: DUF3500 domain-containing protein [Thermodesulfobacteriota bacterium]|nr:DUF3500 domain-containing protein [Thermodesulfobacteriota bacterium]